MQPRLTERDGIERAVARLVAERVALGGRARVLSLRRRRNIFSETALVDIDGGAGGAVERFFVKVLPPLTAGGEDNTAHKARKLASEAALLAEVEAAGISAPRPVACDAEALTIVTTACPGSPLGDRIASRWRRALGPLAGRDAERLVARCGAWLARFHAAVSPPPAAEARDALVSYIHERLRMLRAIDAGSFDAPLAAGIERLADDAARAPAGGGDRHAPAAVVIHNDFTLHNILVEGAELAVIDFTGHGPGFPEDDLRHFARSLARHLRGDGLVPPPFARFEARRLEGRLRRAYRLAGGRTLGSTHPLTRAAIVKHALAEALGATRARLAHGAAGARARRRYRSLLRELAALVAVRDAARGREPT